MKPWGTFFAGILHRPFATKKAAQNSFNLNLKNWGIEKPTWRRGWYRELTVEEYMNEFQNAEGVVGKKMQQVVQGFMDKINKVALSNVLKAMAEQEKAEEEKAEKEKVEKEAEKEKVEQEKADAAQSALSVEELQGRIANLRGHLELLAKLRDENPNLGLYLFPGWEHKTPQEYLENRMRRGFKRRFNEVFARKHEEKREAEMLQELERALEEKSKHTAMEVC